VDVRRTVGRRWLPVVRAARGRTGPLLLRNRTASRTSRVVGDARHGKTVTGAVLAWCDTYVVDEIAVLDSTSDTDSVLQDVREMGSLA
jgi:hypothetical protein